MKARTASAFHVSIEKLSNKYQFSIRKIINFWLFAFTVFSFEDFLTFTIYENVYFTQRIRLILGLIQLSLQYLALICVRVGAIILWCCLTTMVDLIRRYAVLKKSISCTIISIIPPLKLATNNNSYTVDITRLQTIWTWAWFSMLLMNVEFAGNVVKEASRTMQENQYLRVHYYGNTFSHNSFVLKQR